MPTNDPLDFSLSGNFLSEFRKIMESPQDHKEREQSLIELLVDKSSREAFKKFASEHTEIMQSPLFQKLAHQVSQLEVESTLGDQQSKAEDTPLNKGETAVKITHMTHDKALLSTVPTIEELALQHPDKLLSYFESHKGKISKHLGLLLEYVECGILSEKTLIKILAIEKGDGKPILISKFKTLMKYLPTLERIEEEKPGFLKNLFLGNFQELVSHHRTDPEILASAFDLLERLAAKRPADVQAIILQEEAFETVSTNDSDTDTVTSSSSNLEEGLVARSSANIFDYQAFLPLFEKLAVTQPTMLKEIILSQFLGFGYADESRTSKTLQDILPLLHSLVKLNPDLLFEILRQNIPLTPLIFHDFNVTGPLLEGLKEQRPELVLHLLSLKVDETDEDDVEGAASYWLLKLPEFDQNRDKLLLALVSNHPVLVESFLEPIFTSLLSNPHMAAATLERLKLFLGSLTAKVTIPFLIQLLHSHPQTFKEVMSLKIGTLNLMDNPFFFIILINELEDLYTENPKLVTELLTTKNSFGATPLHFTNNFRNAYNFLLKLASSDPLAFKSIVCIPNSEGHTPFFNPHIINETNNLLEVIYNENLRVFEEIIAQEDFSGNTILHSFLPGVVLLLRDLLLNQNPKFATALLTKQNKTGNCPLHIPHMIGENTIPIASLAQVDLRSIVNEQGISPYDVYTQKLSAEWLSEIKFSPEMAVRLSEHEYVERAQKLREVVEKLWGSVAFGYQNGEVNPILLDTQSDYVKQEDLLTKEQIESLHATITQSLNLMLTRIVTHEAWRGTPREGDTIGLISFYTVMMVNFEKLASVLQEENNPHKTAGFLIDLAKINFDETEEGRCAAAYQSDISMAAKLTSKNPKEFSLQTQIDDSLAKALQAYIDGLVGLLSGGDSHDMNQLMHAATMLPVPDPLANIPVPQAKKLLLDNFSLQTFTKDFNTELTEEIISAYIKEKTPQAFDRQHPFFLRNQLYQRVIQEAKDLEGLHILVHKRKLTETRGIDPKIADSVLELFRTQRGNLDPLIPFFRKTDETSLINAVLAYAESRLEFLIGKNSVSLKELLPTSKEFSKKDLNTFESELTAITAKYRPKLKLGASKEEIQAYGDLRRAAPNEITTIKALLNATQDFSKALTRLEITSKDTIAALLMEKSSYQKAISDIPEVLKKQFPGQNFEFAFKLQDYPLPSQAYENARRVEFNASHLTTRARSLLHILNINGVTTNTP